jgi:DNA-binding IclR family transcriptional regulator
MPDKYLSRFERLHALIKIKATGPPAILAHKLGISESTLYEYLQTLKAHGAPLKYCKTRRSYYYESTGEFHFRFLPDKN